MSDHTLTAIVSVLLAALGLAVIAVLVGSGSATTGVFSSTGGAISNLICQAVAPVTGKSCASSLTSITSGFCLDPTGVNCPHIP